MFKVQQNNSDMLFWLFLVSDPTISTNHTQVLEKNSSLNRNYSFLTEENSPQFEGPDTA